MLLVAKPYFLCQVKINFFRFGHKNNYRSNGHMRFFQLYIYPTWDRSDWSPVKCQQLDVYPRFSSPTKVQIMANKNLVCKINQIWLPAN